MQVPGATVGIDEESVAGAGPPTRVQWNRVGSMGPDMAGRSLPVAA